MKSVAREDLASEYADETGFLEDFDLSRMGSMMNPDFGEPQGRQTDKARKQERDRQ